MYHFRNVYYEGRVQSTTVVSDTTICIRFATQQCRMMSFHMSVCRRANCVCRCVHCTRCTRLAIIVAAPPHFTPADADRRTSSRTVGHSEAVCLSVSHSPSHARAVCSAGRWWRRLPLRGLQDVVDIVGLSAGRDLLLPAGWQPLPADRHRRRGQGRRRRARQTPRPRRRRRRRRPRRARHAPAAAATGQTLLAGAAVPRLSSVLRGGIDYYRVGFLVAPDRRRRRNEQKRRGISVTALVLIMMIKGAPRTG
jgi:hypothetical protein